MKRLSRIKTIPYVLVIALAFILCISAAAGAFAADDEADEKGVYSSPDELNGKVVGVQVGSTDEIYVKNSIPDAQMEYYSTLPDLINALKANKIDGIATSETSVYELMKQEDDIVPIREPIGGFPCAFVFPKREDNRELMAQMNEFLAAHRENGEIDSIHEIWAGKDESLKVIEDYGSLPAENGTLKVLTEGTYPPYTYFRDGKLIGFDIDLVVRFCKEYGYGVEFIAVNLDAIVPAIESGKGDMAASGLAITAERAEKVDYSDEYYEEKSIVAVLKADTAEESFFSSLKNSFRKTFIQEDRYMLFLKGILNTLIITVLSILFGTLLGFVMYMWYRKGGRPADLITRFSVWLIQGMPGIVLLMILYYVVFSSVSISGIWVAVVGFSLTFAASVHSMIQSGVKAVDNGQTEASYALGFSDTQTFFGIVLPQAARHFLPSYRAEIVSLIKATAVVGYIAVQDLTKMGDIVRSRTYEAFFPLIAVAIIYFVLAGILKAVVDKLTVSVDPEKRSDKKILKGIRTS